MLTFREAIRRLAELGMSPVLLSVIGQTKNWTALEVLMRERLPHVTLIHGEPANDA